LSACYGLTASTCQEVVWGPIGKLGKELRCAAVLGECKGEAAAGLADKRRPAGAKRTDKAA
jgi:hypothetical protein